MGRKEEEQCRRYREERDQAHARMEELVEKGEGALSRYDIDVAASGDVEKALWTALYLTGNHVRYFTERVQECEKLPRQATLFEAPDAHLEMQYEDQQSGYEDH